MAGTRTSPVFTGAATARRISIQLVDASGDTYSESLYVPVAATDAAIEALIADYQAASQASVYDVVDSFTYLGEIDPANAETDQRNSVKDGINILYKDGVEAKAIRLVAPVPAVMVANQDIVDTADALFTAFVTSSETLLTPYAVESAQYTQRRERRNNPRSKV